jgi:hypothetical protein
VLCGRLLTSAVNSLLLRESFKHTGNGLRLRILSQSGLVSHGPVAAAIDLWSSAAALTGGQEETLQNVDVRIADLPGARLGEASGTSITPDINAAGYGWFVDATPRNDVEFTDTTPHGEPTACLRHLLPTASIS